MQWINFLHFYQPPYQDKALLKIIVKESYNFLLSFLKKNSKVNFTINFTGSLTELLEHNGHHKIIEGFKDLASKGQIELVATAKFHPILPFLPDKEIKRQIELNDKINKAYFGAAYNPRGFFCPEMAYSEKVGKILKELGYQWIILDEISYNGKLGQADPLKKYIDVKTGLRVIFRNRKISKSFVPETIIKEKFSDPVITATDAEMYGHYHKDPQKYLKEVTKSADIETLTISSFLKRLKEEEKVNLIEASWETLEKDLASGRPFYLWNNPKNDFHNLLWKLADMAIKLNYKYNANNKNSWARRHLDRGLASCTWWWMSERKVDVFSPWSWNPDEVEKGVEELIRSIRSLKDAPAQAKIKAEKLAGELTSKVWERHWQIIGKNER